MDDTGRKRLDELCSLISHEENAGKFSLLVDELNQLLEKEEEELKRRPGSNDSGQ